VDVVSNLLVDDIAAGCQSLWLCTCVA